MRSISLRAISSAGLALLCGATWATDQIPASAFAHFPDVSTVRLSPDGKHIAVRAELDNGKSHALAVYSVNDMAHPFMLRMQPNEVPNDIQWVSDRRIIIEKAKQFGAIDAPVPTGEIITTDIDGKHQDYLYGYAANHQSSRGSTRNPDYGSGFYVGGPQEPNDHFYMSARLWDSHGGTTLYDVDSMHNTRHIMTSIGVDGMSFLVDAKGTARFAYGQDDDAKSVLYQSSGSGWSKVNWSTDGAFVPLGFMPDQQHVYAVYSADGGPTSLVEQAADGSDRKVLGKDDFSSVVDYQLSAPPGVPFAYSPDTGLPRISYIDPNRPEAKLHMALSLKFSGEYVDFVDFSQDGGTLLFKVNSDRDPGTYYLIDTRTYKVTKLFSLLPTIDPAKMAERRPIRFTNRDGMELDGYLTLPPGRPDTGLPMVLVPHGGPINVRDTWFFDQDAQFLANRGYAVLQVNYRGSSGRGKNFEDKGNLNWGTGIQQDLIDGVKWAIGQKIADANRICVYGGSFGGYSAMMTPIRAPGMFKCAIGYAGIYDLALMYKKGDIKDRKSGRSYLREVIGKDDAALDANSPDKLADKIDVPVLLVHGEMDQRAPIEQFQAMRAALDAENKPYQVLIKPGEGHGFYDEKNVVEFYDTLQAFLEKYIGKGA